MSLLMSASIMSTALGSWWTTTNPAWVGGLHLANARHLKPVLRNQTQQPQQQDAPSHAQQHTATTQQHLGWEAHPHASTSIIYSDQAYSSHSRSWMTESSSTAVQ